MPIRYDLTKITSPNIVDDPYVYPMCQWTVALGIPVLTEKNHKDFYLRSRLYVSLFGGERLDYATVRRFIGLETNAQDVSVARWRRLIVENYTTGIGYELVREIQSLDALTKGES